MDMSAFVDGLARDLDGRCTRLIGQLQDHQTHPDVAEFSQDMVDRLRRVSIGIYALLASGQLDHEALLPYALSDYQDLNREVALVEQFGLPIVLRYGSRDHRCRRLLEHLISELGFPAELMPIVTTTSDQYYWAHPALHVIGLPAGDLDGGILGWPDLIHELGHLWLAKYPSFLTSFTPAVNDYFRSQRDRLADLGGQRKDNQWLAIAQIKWGEKREGTWRVELAADLIATYLTGPAYGWQHLRLAANHGDDPYHPSPGHVEDHPANQARLEGILSMLGLLGVDDQIDNIGQRWQKFLKIGLYDQLPPGYQLYYPDTLIHKLAEIVFAGCQQSGLVPFTAHECNADLRIMGLIDQAWQMFNRDPLQYQTWEQQAIERLRDDLKQDMRELTSP